MTPRTDLALHQAVADFATRPHDDTLEERQRAALLPAKHIADKAMASVMARALRPGLAGHIYGGRIVGVLLKPVSDHCNLRCTYCYEGDDAARQSSPRIRPELLVRTIEQSCEQASDTIQFIWHGGEPLLAGRELFEAGLAAQRSFREAGLRIDNSIQTNGTLLTEEWIDFLVDAGFSIGLSLDGPPDLHDRRRIDAKGHGTHAVVVEAMRRLQARDITFGTICVFGAAHLGRAAETVRHFHQLGLRQIDLHPDVGMIGNPGNDDISPQAFADFMVEAFETWLEIADPEFRIQMVDDFIRGWLGPSPRTCYFNGSCRRIIAVEPNGDVIPCTRPFDRQDATFGNLSTQGLDEVLDGEKMGVFIRNDTQAMRSTRDCRWGYLCNGGCPQHRRSPQRTAEGREDIAGINPYCRCMSGIEGGHAAVWDHISARFTQLFCNAAEKGPDQGSDPADKGSNPFLGRARR